MVINNVKSEFFLFFFFHRIFTKYETFLQGFPSLYREEILRRDIGMDMKTQLAIATNLHSLRNIFGYTQRELSEKIHISRSTYAVYETGAKIPSTDIILNLADLYNIRVDTILQRDSTKFINDLLLSNMSENYLNNLIKIFRDLSPYSRDCLLRRAETLLRTERDRG